MLHGNVALTSSFDQAGRPAISAAWTYFRINDDDKSGGDCKLCSARVSRGGVKSRSVNTSNLIKYVKNRHKAEPKEFANAISAKQQQPLLLQTPEKWEKVSRDDSQAVKIAGALDVQSLTLKTCFIFIRCFSLSDHNTFNLHHEFYEAVTDILTLNFMFF